MLAPPPPKVELKKLQSLYSSDPDAKALLDHFAARERNQNTTYVRRLKSNLASEGAAVSRGQIIRVLKELEELDCGAFKAGRKGHESRFEWHVASRSVGQVAAGEGTEIEPDVPPKLESEEELGDDTIEHRYQLRPQLAVSITLPSDFSASEAQRLARFIMTLPFGRGAETRSASIAPLFPEEDFSDWMK